MELSTKTLHPISFQDPDLNTNHDTTNFESTGSFLRTEILPVHDAGHDVSSSKDISPEENARITEVHSVDKKNGLPRCSANEMVNVCYAKICCRRGQTVTGCLEDEDERYDEYTMDHVFPTYFEKDLDKLRKLRLKSKLKTKKYKERAEVKKWLETPDKFLRVLKDIRLEKESGPSEVTVNNTDVEASSDNSANVSSLREKKGSKNQVHFPEHVLLCGALQERDPKEVESIINNYKIDLNSLSRLTGYHYLHKTITNGQLNCAKILIQNGIDVNAKDSEGVSPIALAFRLMNFQMVALLVDCGVNLWEYTKFRISELERVKELSRSVSKVFEMDL